MKKSKVDIVIIGAGPAGAQCARLLATLTPYSIVLIDQRSFDGSSGSRKACGGLLSSHAQKELRVDGLFVPESIKVQPQLNSVSTTDLRHHLHQFYKRTYINIDRALFEDWLIELIPKPVQRCFTTRITKIEQLSQSTVVFGQCGTQEIQVECKILIGADGANSLVRQIFFADRPFPKRYIALQHRFQTQGESDSYFGFFDESLTDYYAWALQKKDELLIGSAFELNGNIHQKFERLKSEIKDQTQLKFGDVYETEGAMILRPTSLNQLSFSKGTIALIGEASGSISPSSAEGFSYALKSARLVARNIKKYGLTQKALHHYDQAAWKIRFTILLKLFKLPFMYQPSLRRWVMLSRITSIKPKEPSNNA